MREIGENEETTTNEKTKESKKERKKREKKERKEKKSKRECPDCAEDIKKEAIRCRHCGAEIPPSVARKIRSTLESILEEWPTLVLVSLATIGFYQLALEVETEPWHQIFEHLAIALVVALVLMITVEVKAKKRTTDLTGDFTRKTKKEIQDYRDSVAREVWKATCGRAVPKEIVRLLDGILKYDVVKEDCQYVFTFLSYSSGTSRSRHNQILGSLIPSQIYVLRREVTYQVRNLTDREISFDASATTVSEFPDTIAEDGGERIVIPRHVAMRIDDEDIDLTPGEDSPLSKYDGYPHRRLSRLIRVPPDGLANVYICSEEEIRGRGKSSYIQLSPMIGVTVVIKNHLDDRIKILTASLNHPNWKDFTEGAKGVYSYRGGVLPGQGVRLSWIPKGQEPPNAS